QGRPVHFVPWYGALAHAIFFPQGSLDYFHTHVCAPGASGCTSALGGTTVTGRSSTPGKLNVGVLVPAPGKWRLFLQTNAGGHVLTAPFTLTVKPLTRTTAANNHPHCRRLSHSSGRTHVRVERVGARTRQSTGRAREGALPLHARRPDGEVGSDDADRAHAPVRVQHRLLRAIARLEADRAAV